MDVALFSFILSSLTRLKVGGIKMIKESQGSGNDTYGQAVRRLLRPLFEPISWCQTCLVNSEIVIARLDWYVRVDQWLANVAILDKSSDAVSARMGSYRVVISGSGWLRRQV